jgi:penicillin-binding protein 2
LANVAAILANRGYYYTPHLVKSIEGNTDTSWLQKFRQIHRTTINPKHFETVIEGMSKVMQPGGTGNGTGIPGIDICGKTGTAQNPHGKDHSLFISFAPRNNPKIAVAVIVENAGFGSTYAAPISNLVIEKYLYPDTTTKVPYLLERIKNSVLEPQ